MNGAAGQEDIEAIPTHRENSSEDNELRNIGSRNETLRPESMEILSGEMNLRLCQEMNSLLNMISK